MSAHIYKEALVASDFVGFSNGNCVARVYSQMTGWYIGICQHIGFDTITTDLCLIRLEVLISFDCYSATSDPYDPGKVIFTSADRVKGKPRGGLLPFRLYSSQKVVPQESDPLVLIIQGEEKNAPKVAVISKRPQDILAVRQIPEFAEFLKS